MAKNRIIRKGNPNNMNNKNKKPLNSPNKRRLGLKTKPVLTDARQKIIQKKRKTVVDARDVLARLGKVQDARTKLQKIRGDGKAGGPVGVRQIGKNILRKTDRNGQISLVTNKNRPVASMNNKIREQLGMSVTPQRPKKSPLKRPIKENPQIIRKTIQNEYTASVANAAYYAPDMYRVYPGLSPMLAPIELRRPLINMEVPQMVSERNRGDWNVPSRMHSDYDMVVDDDIPMATMSRPGMTRAPSNVHSRLDSAISPESHGIMAQPKTKVVVPVGHRIVVSNLQATVTQDDIRELFEDIGQLLVARLVRPGIAEVIYKNLKDAQKAVDTYHNRQLDGQPMKCLLVNKRPLNNPTAPAIKTSNESNVSTSSKLVPDISTIHKVLFQRK